ncbi:hypothetical protein BJ165DRAFT_1398362 [Panaeolus papilionaceus]|nr:hypothetical protein BJ165DRAFT_1398362 [Panaeolus papilionaceus]
MLALQKREERDGDGDGSRRNANGSGSGEVKKAPQAPKGAPTQPKKIVDARKADQGRLKVRLKVPSGNDFARSEKRDRGGQSGGGSGNGGIEIERRGRIRVGKGIGIGGIRGEMRVGALIFHIFDPGGTQVTPGHRNYPTTNLLDYLNLSESVYSTTLHNALLTTIYITLICASTTGYHWYHLRFRGLWLCNATQRDNVLNINHCPLGMYVLPSPAGYFVWDGVLFIHQTSRDHPPSVEFVTEVFHPLVSHPGAFNLGYHYKLWRIHENDRYNKEAFRLCRDSTPSFANLAAQSAQLSSSDSVWFDTNDGHRKGRAGQGVSSGSGSGSVRSSSDRGMSTSATGGGSMSRMASGISTTGTIMGQGREHRGQG